MKIVVLIVRLLLGLVFFVFGLNAFLQFLKGPIPGGLAGQFLQALFQSHYGLAIGAVQAVGGALLLINRYVPLALTILGPVIVNILLYHLLLNHEGIGGALIVAVFWFALFFHYCQYFSGIFTAKASSASLQGTLAGLRGPQALIAELAAGRRLQKKNSAACDVAGRPRESGAPITLHRASASSYTDLDAMLLVHRSQ